MTKDISPDGIILTPDNHSRIIKNETYSMENGIKVSPQLINPLEMLLLEVFVIPSKPYFKQMNLHPNHLTFLSFLFGIIGAYLVYKSRFLWASLFLFLAYLFDCIDGNYARTYDMVTDFGDFFDHSTDIIQMVLLYIAVFLNKDLTKNNKIAFAIVIGILLLFMCVDFGCQEKIYNTKESPSLSILRTFCIGDVNNTIHYVKYSSCATVYLVIIFFMFYFAVKTQKV